jgi:hypothetical protein
MLTKSRKQRTYGMVQTSHLANFAHLSRTVHMTTMNISLPDSLKDFVGTQVG